MEVIAVRATRGVIPVLLLTMQLATPAFAQFPGEPKMPDAYDPVAQMKYNFERGAPNAIVLEAQLVLRDLGYYAGDVDGIMGPEVKAAIGNFQTSMGLPRSASLDRMTMVVLGLTGSEAAYASPPTLGAETPSPRHLDDVEAP
jgi:peptidoglycan hydrolase-like protein with peptidoglycan-binding domain